MEVSQHLEELINSTAGLASLPSVFHRIDAAVENPYSTLDQIATIIMEDPGLAARLLKIANSSFYSFPQPVETITRALTVVGTGQLRDLVMATSAISQFQGVSPDLISTTDFWRHSIACGLAARVIATYRREANVESFYVAGLLHDVGRLVLFLNRPRPSAVLLQHCRNQGTLLYLAEHAAVGFDHASVGGALLAKWKLPERLLVPVRYHHQPAGAQSFAVETAIVHVADIVAHSMRLGASGEMFIPPLDPWAWERVGLSPGLIPTIAKQIDKQYGEAVRLFS